MAKSIKKCTWHTICRFDTTLFGYAMLQYLKLFIRKVQREKIFSLINILGLSLGITCSLLIYLYIHSELSHDKFHVQANNIYRINQTLIWSDDNDQLFSSTGPGVSIAIKENIPEVEKITRIHTPGNFIVTRKQENNIISFEEDNIIAADSNFFDVFTFPLKQGNPKTSLHKPNSVVMSEEAARKYFPDEEPIGKMVQLGRGGESTNYVVTGVLEEIPENSYIEFDLLLSMSSFPRVEKQNWTWIWTTFETYVVLNEYANIDAVKIKLSELPRTHAETTLQRIMGTTFEDYVKGGKEWKLYLQPITEIHLGSVNVHNRLNSVGNQTVVNVLGVAGIFILLLSCINYMNLKTSQITKYAKNTGVRKMMGSSKTRISFQYMVESLLFVSVSIAIGLLLTYYSLPFFNNITGKGVNPAVFLTPEIFGYLILMAFVMSVLSGSYPALLLSAFTPLDVLRGKVSTGHHAKSLRNSFIVIQFAISIGLMASTAIVYQQLQYTFNKDVGFQKDNLIVINRVEWLKGRKSFITELTKIPGVLSTSLNTSMPPYLFNGDQFLSEEDQSKNIPLNYSQVDGNYVSTLGIEIIHGRNFSEIAEREKYSVIINESAVKSLGWDVTNDVLQKKIIYPGNQEPFNIIGIAKDFNYWALQSGIEPMALFHIDNPVMGFYGNFFAAVRVESGDFSNTLIEMENLWKSQNPSVAFSYEFIDDAFASSFQSTEQFRKSLSVFAGLALFIAGLGLFGMIVYVVEQKTKEIGIRKVLGSNPKQVVMLMSKKFIFLVFLSFLISIPFTYWAMNKWLMDFEYKVVISPWIFIVSGGAALLFAFSIVGFQSYRAALMNPTAALKDE